MLFSLAIIGAIVAFTAWSAARRAGSASAPLAQLVAGRVDMVLSSVAGV